MKLKISRIGNSDTKKYKRIKICEKVCSLFVDALYIEDCVYLIPCV